MVLFDKKSSFLLLIFFIPLLFIPKINLISLSDETAGIRYDDILLFCLALVISWAHVALHKNITTIERYILAILTASLVSYALNILFVQTDILQAKARLPYAIRLFEYFLFFYLGIMASRFCRCGSLLMAFFSWNLAIILLQKFEVLGGVMSGVYVPLTSWRVLGIASFPAELGLLLNLLYCYFAFSDTKAYLNRIPKHWRRITNAVGNYVLFALFAVLISLTGSRISLATLTFCFFGKLFIEFKTYSTSLKVPAIAISLGIMLVFGSILTYSDAIYERSTSLLSMGNFEIIDEIWNSIDTNALPIADETAKELNESQADLSWWIRLHRWSYALKVYISHPASYLFGVGPGFASTAMDGGWLRILTENGVVGLFLYIGLFRHIARQNKQLFWMVAAFGLNMIFFDAYLAYKPMSLLFLTLGMTSVQLADAAENRTLVGSCKTS